MSNRLSKYWKTCIEYKSKIFSSFSHWDSGFSFGSRVASCNIVVNSENDPFLYFLSEAQERGNVRSFSQFFRLYFLPYAWNTIVSLLMLILFMISCNCVFFPQLYWMQVNKIGFILKFKLIEIIVYYLFCSYFSKILFFFKIMMLWSKRFVFQL